MLLWHGVFDDAGDANRDRLTAMTMGPPPSLDLELDSLADLIEDIAKKPATAGPARWTAAVHRDDKTTIFGYYAGRPPPEAAAALFSRILNGAAKPLISYSAKGGNISISLPPKR